MAGCSHSTIALFVCRCINIYSRMASRNLTSVHSAPSLALIKVTSARICLCTAKRKIGCATSEYPSLQAFLFQGVDASDYGLAVTVNTCIVWLRTSGSVCCIFGEGNFQLRFVASPSKISSASQVFGMLFFFSKKNRSVQQICSCVNDLQIFPPYIPVWGIVLVKTFTDW